MSSGSLLSDLLVLFSASPGGHGGRGQGHPGRHVQTVQEPQYHLQHSQQTAGQEPQAVCHNEGGEWIAPVGAGNTRNNAWENAENAKILTAISVGSRKDGASGSSGKEAGGQSQPSSHQEQLQGPHLPGRSEVRGQNHIEKTLPGEHFALHFPLCGDLAEHDLIWFCNFLHLTSQ